MASRIDELREMSDAELDRIAAEVVMGWTFNDEMDCWVNKEHNRFPGRHDFDPSSSIATAFKMLGEKFPPSRYSLNMNSAEKEWVCYITRDGVDAVARCATLPRAITIAAILAAESKA